MRVAMQRMDGWDLQREAALTGGSAAELLLLTSHARVSERQQGQAKLGMPPNHHRWVPRTLGQCGCV